MMWKGTEVADDVLTHICLFSHIGKNEVLCLTLGSGKTGIHPNLFSSAQGLTPFHKRRGFCLGDFMALRSSESFANKWGIIRRGK